MFMLGYLLGMGLDESPRGRRGGGNPWAIIEAEIGYPFPDPEIYLYKNSAKVISKSADKISNQGVKNGNDIDNIDDGTSYG